MIEVVQEIMELLKNKGRLSARELDEKLLKKWREEYKKFYDNSTEQDQEEGVCSKKILTAIEETIDAYGNTILQLAVRENLPKFVNELVLEHYVSVLQKNFLGQNAYVLTAFIRTQDLDDEDAKVVMEKAVENTTESLDLEEQSDSTLFIDNAGLSFIDHAWLRSLYCNLSLQEFEYNIQLLNHVCTLNDPSSYEVVGSYFDNFHNLADLNTRIQNFVISLAKYVESLEDGSSEYNFKYYYKFLEFDTNFTIYRDYCAGYIAHGDKTKLEPLPLITEFLSVQVKKIKNYIDAHWDEIALITKSGGLLHNLPNEVQTIIKKYFTLEDIQTLKGVYSTKVINTPKVSKEESAEPFPKVQKLSGEFGENEGEMYNNLGEAHQSD